MNNHLDRIAARCSSPEVLNSIHACRDNHPMGIGNAYKFRNALIMVGNHAHMEAEAMRWLEKQAKKEASQ